MSKNDLYSYHGKHPKLKSVAPNNNGTDFVVQLACNSWVIYS